MLSLGLIATLLATSHPGGDTRIRDVVEPWMSRHTLPAPQLKDVFMRRTSNTIKGFQLITATCSTCKPAINGSLQVIGARLGVVSTAKSAAECANACLAHPQCVSFTYAPAVSTVCRINKFSETYTVLPGNGEQYYLRNSAPSAHRLPGMGDRLQTSSIQQVQYKLRVPTVRITHSLRKKGGLTFISSFFLILQQRPL